MKEIKFPLPSFIVYFLKIHSGFPSIFFIVVGSLDAITGIPISFSSALAEIHF